MTTPAKARKPTAKLPVASSRIPTSGEPKIAVSRPPQPTIAWAEAGLLGTLDAAPSKTAAYGKPTPRPVTMSPTMATGSAGARAIDRQADNGNGEPSPNEPDRRQPGFEDGPAQARAAIPVTRVSEPIRPAASMGSPKASAR